MPDFVREFAFICYAHENLSQVLKIYDGLKKRNVNVWLDKKNLKTGRWKQQILSAICHSKYFIFCLSNAALLKTSGDIPGFQDVELQTAWEFASEQDEKVFTIIPVRLEDCDRGDLRLSGWQQYDLFEDWEGVLDTLAVNLGGVSFSDARALDNRSDDEKIIAGIMGKAELFYYSGDYIKALSFYDSALYINPDDKKAWYNKGVALGKLGSFDEALKAYDKAIEIKKDKHEAWNNKGNALKMLGRFDEALKAYDKAIEIKKDYHEAWYNKGAALDDLGRFDEALKAYDKAIKIKKDYHKAWNKKGSALEKLGRVKDAKRAFKIAEEIKKNSNN